MSNPDSMDSGLTDMEGNSLIRVSIIVTKKEMCSGCHGTLIDHKFLIYK